MGDLPGVFWTKLNFLESYGLYRQKFREATSKAVRKAMDEHAQGTILEVGSGLGELARLVPEYKCRIQQTELDEDVIAEHLKLNPESNIIRADAFELQFPKKIFGTVVAFSVFDAIQPLDKAVEEAQRVLLPGGKFINFLDLQASPKCRGYDSNAEVPFPFYERAENGLNLDLGFYMVRREDLPELREKFDPDLRQWFDVYISAPAHLFFTTRLQPCYFSVLERMSDFVANSGLETRALRFNDWFKSELESSIAKAGLKLIKSEFISSEAIVERDESWNDDYNLFYNDSGFDRSKRDDSLALPDGKVKCVSRLYVAVAEKP